MAIENSLHRKLTRSDIADGDNLLQSEFFDKYSENDDNINNCIDSIETIVDDVSTILRDNEKNWANSAITGFKTIIVKSDTDNTSTTFNGASNAAKRFTFSAVSPVSIAKKSDEYVFDIVNTDISDKSFSSYLSRAGFSNSNYAPSLPFLRGSDSFGTMGWNSFANTIQSQKIYGCYFGQRTNNITAVADPIAANTESRFGYNPSDGSEMIGYANTDVLDGSFVFQTEYDFTRRYEATNASIGLFEHFTATNYSIAVKGGVANSYSIAYGDNDSYDLSTNNVANADTYSNTLLRNSHATNHGQCISTFNSSADNYSLCLANAYNNVATYDKIASNYSVNMLNNAGIDANANNNSLIANSDATTTNKLQIRANNHSFVFGKSSNSDGILSECNDYSFAFGSVSRPVSAIEHSFVFATKGNSNKLFATNCSFGIFGGATCNSAVPTIDNCAITLMPVVNYNFVKESIAFENSAFICGVFHETDKCRLSNELALSMANSFAFASTLSAATIVDDASMIFNTTAAKIPRSLVIKGSSSATSATTATNNSEYYNSISLYANSDVKMNNGVALFKSVASDYSLAMFASTASAINDLNCNVALFNSVSNGGFALFDSTTNCEQKSIAMFGSTTTSSDKLVKLFDNTFDTTTLPSFKFKAVTSTAAADIDSNVIYLLY